MVRAQTFLSEREAAALLAAAQTEADRLRVHAGRVPEVDVRLQELEAAAAKLRTLVDGVDARFAAAVAAAGGQVVFAAADLTLVETELRALWGDR